MTRTSVPLMALVAGFALVAPTAHGAAPPPWAGGHYTSDSKAVRGAVDMDVAGRTAKLAVRFSSTPCGPVLTKFDNVPVEVGISSTGAFRARKRFRELSSPGVFSRIHTYEIAGAISGDGTKLRGTVRYVHRQLEYVSTRGPVYTTCRTPMLAFKATWRRSIALTARQAGAWRGTTRGGQPVSFTLGFGDGGNAQITDFSVDFPLECGDVEGIQMRMIAGYRHAFGPVGRDGRFEILSGDEYTGIRFSGRIVGNSVRDGEFHPMAWNWDGPLTPNPTGQGRWICSEPIDSIDLFTATKQA